MRKNPILGIFSRKYHAKILLTMKLTTVLVLISTLQLSATTFSQEAKLTLNIKNGTLASLFKEIEKQSSYSLFYKDNQIDLTRKITVVANDKSVSDILKDVLANENVSYTMMNKIVVFTPKNQQQGMTVTGVISDEKGESLPGVTVAIKGTTRALPVGVDGKYTIDVNNGDDVLVFSLLGYNTQEIKVGTQKVINIKLSEDVKKLQEVVVVGYGTQKKSDITGSVTSVSKDRLSKIPVTNVMNALEGAVPGVNVTQSYATPGSSPSVLVRSRHSINANTDPLYILDGIPYEGNINYINSNDIASMEILKDASAVAIYGSRGANGVILINTKKGATGKPTIQYSSFAGVEKIAHVLDPMSPAQYVQKYADYMAQSNQTQTAVLPNLYEIQNYNAGITTNWVDLATQTGVMQDHNLSVSGGTESLKYYISGNYSKDKGVVKGYEYQRAGIRTNLEAKVTDFMTAGLGMFLVNNDYGGGKANLLLAAAMSPYGQVNNNITGKYQIYPMYPELLYTNPMLGLYSNNEDKRNNINTNFFTEISPSFIKGLKYRLNASINYNPNHSATYTGRDGGNTIGSASITDTKTNLWVVENILSYSKDIKKHHFDFTGLYSSQKQTYFTSNASSTGFINDLLTYNNLSAGTTQTVSSWSSSYTMVSQMGRLNYSYDSRYLLTATVRRDGYSAFGSNTDKYGVFPSIALGWNISNENFMKSFSNVLDQLKLRASYGKSGMNAVGVNQTSSSESAVKEPFASSIMTGVLASSALGNKNLHWESTVGFNVALDFSLLNARIRGTVEAYSSHTSDLLLKRSLPQIGGYSTTWDNIGLVATKGLEVTLNTVNVKTKKFTWSTSLNFSTDKNEIRDLYGDKKSDVGNRWFIGQPIGVIYDYKMTGVWQTSEATDAAKYSCKPGYLKFQDVNGDGKYDSNDQVLQGQTAPKWRGGITNTFSYENLTLSVFIQTSQGSKRNNPNISGYEIQGRMNGPAAYHYWTSTNASNEYPSLVYDNTWGYGYPRDNSYTRIKDVTLSYNFSPELLNRTFIKNLTLYVSGRNLYTFTNWIGWDPEVSFTNRGMGSGDGSWTNDYPNVRTIVFGLNVSLK
ncbi:MAG: TonB-dependent receptor [Bacteroidota bacterium]|nr:TonB-dependent receptor [Bacteroidota bacterium]